MQFFHMNKCLIIFYEGHPIKNETFAIAQWINMLDLLNHIQS